MAYLERISANTLQFMVRMEHVTAYAELFFKP